MNPKLNQTPWLRICLSTLMLIAVACNGEPKGQSGSAAPSSVGSASVPTPSPVETVIPVESPSPTESSTPTPKLSAAKATGPKFVERYDPVSQSFEKAVELEGGDSIGVAEWNRLWDPNDPRFKEQVGSRYSRFAGDGEFSSSGEVTVDRPNRKKGVTRVTHCSKTSGQLRRRG